MNFSHEYRKLERKIFPSVRSVNYTTDHNLKIGDFDEIFVKDKKKGVAVFIAEESNRICNMDLAFLRYDSACSLPKVETKQEYVDLLNSFIRPWTSNKLQTIKSILWFRWVEK